MSLDPGGRFSKQSKNLYSQLVSQMAAFVHFFCGFRIENFDTPKYVWVLVSAKNNETIRGTGLFHAHSGQFEQPSAVSGFGSHLDNVGRPTLQIYMRPLS